MGRLGFAFEAGQAIGQDRAPGFPDLVAHAAPLVDQRLGEDVRELLLGITQDIDGKEARLLERLQAEGRSEEHTSELQSLMRISYAVFCLKKKKRHTRLH